MPSCVLLTALEAAQGKNDSFVSQLPHKFYLEEVASVADRLQICPQVACRVGPAGPSPEGLARPVRLDSGQVAQTPRHCNLCEGWPCCVSSSLNQGAGDRGIGCAQRIEIDGLSHLLHLTPPLICVRGPVQEHPCKHLILLQDLEFRVEG